VLSCELFTISNLLKAADANELEIDDLGLAAISRYWPAVSDITGRVASTENGRIAKLRAAQIATNYEEAARSPESRTDPAMKTWSRLVALALLVAIAILTWIAVLVVLAVPAFPAKLQPSA
jgi:hypothetical protein